MASEDKSPHRKLMKVDSLGRVRTTRQQREAILAEFDQSGLSGTRFAEIHGIKYLTFVGWLQDRKRWRAADKGALASVPAVAAKVELTEVVVSHRPEPTIPLQVQLPGGITLQIADAHQARLAAQLIRALS